MCPCPALTPDFFAVRQGACSQPNRTNMRFFVSPSRTTRTSPNWCRRWIWLRWGTASPWHTPVSIASAEVDRTCLHPPPSVCSAFTSPDPLRAFINFVESDIGRRARTGSSVSACVNCCVGTREGLLFLRCAAGFLRSISAAAIKIHQSSHASFEQIYTFLNGCRLPPARLLRLDGEVKQRGRAQKSGLWCDGNKEDGRKKTPRCIYVSKLQWWFFFFFLDVRLNICFPETSKQTCSDSFTPTQSPFQLLNLQNYLPHLPTAHLYGPMSW